jgi:hypothetical protein
LTHPSYVHATADLGGSDLISKLPCTRSALHNDLRTEICSNELSYATDGVTQLMQLVLLPLPQRAFAEAQLRYGRWIPSLTVKCAQSHVFILLQIAA